MLVRRWRQGRRTSREGEEEETKRERTGEEKDDDKKAKPFFHSQFCFCITEPERILLPRPNAKTMARLAFLLVALVALFAGPQVLAQQQQQQPAAAAAVTPEKVRTRRVFFLVQ